MAKRRPYGEGSIFKVGDRWRAQLNLGTVNGKRRRMTIVAATRAEVQDQLVAALAAQKRGTLARGAPMTLGDYLDGWLEGLNVREGTAVAYRQKIELHVKPVLGAVRLDKLTARQLDELFRAKSHQLAPQSVAHIRTVLHTALRKAVKYELIARNPVDLTEPISVQQYDATFLTPEQARAFLAATAGDRLEALYSVALSLGLRQGEALGLRWAEVDLERRTLTVRATLQRHVGKGLVLCEPKTKRSRRTIPLPNMAVRPLRAQRARQNAERLRAGALWIDHDLVFTTLQGRPLSASHVVHSSFRAVCDRAGVAYGTRERKGLRFHDLRHSAATLLLAQGIPQRVVMEILGHTRQSTTERYMHVAAALMTDAARAMDRALG
jgi:integrase